MAKGSLKFSVLLITVFVSAAFFRWSADPSAVVVSVSGGVQVQRAGQSAATAAAVGLSLMPGDKVIVGNGAKATLLYKTGKMLATTASVTIEDAQRDKPGGLFSQTVTTIAQVATTNARAQPNRQGMIRPIAGEPAPIAPRNGLKVADLHPTFTWFKLPDAKAYIVQLRRVEPFASKPERFNVSGDTAWVYPGNATPLIPGAVYEWTVADANGGRPARPQRFRLLSGDDFNHVASTFNELLSAGIDPVGDGLFLTALAYRDAGLMYDASKILDRLAAGGAKGKAYYLLRGEVYDALGDLDAAAAAFATADAEPNT
jgi:hypothetical protein